MKARHDQTQIAKLLDRYKSTISRELSRNRCLKGYRLKQACATATKRSEKCRKATTVPPWVVEQAACLLNYSGTLKWVNQKKMISSSELLSINSRFCGGYS